MITKIVLSFVGVVAAVVLAGAAYFYYYPAPVQQEPAVQLPPAATPDNSVVAGPVTAVSAKSISVKKQDGVVVTLSLGTSTQVTLAGAGGQTGTPKKVSDIQVNSMVLVTPDAADITAAQSVVLLPAPPVQ
jgi:hypothetical protein